MDQVGAWVDTISSLLANFVELTSHDFPRAHLKRTHHSPNRPRRIRRRLDPSTPSSTYNSSETDSNADASSGTSLDSRRLKPTSPLMKRKGSQSPERTQRVLLEQGKPPIRIRQPDSTSQIISSQEIQGILSEDFSDCFVPTYFKGRLREADPVAFRNDIRSHMLDRSDETQLAQAEIDRLESFWSRVQSIHAKAKRCNDKNKDENAWARVVWDILETVIREDNATRLEINSVQSRNVHSDFLPLSTSGLNVSKTADFVLAFDDENDDNVRRAYEKFKSNNKGATLSPMTDAYTSGIALACAIELKEAGGKATEAEMQLAVYHAAMLWKIRELINMARKTPIDEEEVEKLVPSVAGWTVIGHKWSLYISSLLPDNSIMYQGPFDGLEASTSTRHGILLLLDLLNHVVIMASSKLWPTM